MDPPIWYLDFRPGWVVKGHIVKLNVSFDPVQLISSFRQTVNLGLLSAAFKNQTRIGNASTFEICHTVLQLQLKWPHSFNSLKDDGSSSTACSKCLQTRRGLPQIHGCY